MARVEKGGLGEAVLTSEGRKIAALGELQLKHIDSRGRKYLADMTIRHRLMELIATDIRRAA
jgi:hypothetical protein